MSKHEKSISHLTSTAKLNAYKITLQSENVLTQISTAHKKQIIKNRNYVKVLIDFTLYLARQGIPFRGHDECKESFNQGKLKN